MRKPSVNSGRQGSRASLLLLALLLFRAYIPVGFMPTSGMPFALELCPAGMPAAHLHHHAGSHADFETCPFGSAPAAGPISHLAFEFAASAPCAAIVAFEAPRFSLRPQLTHLPRGPPSIV